MQIASSIESLNTWLRGLSRRRVLPFIIVGMPRTGSTLVVSSLQQHPNLTVHEELFHFTEAERAMRHAISHRNASIYFDANGGDALGFLKDYVFIPQFKSI